MKKYTVVIEERLNRLVDVEAETAEEAEAIVTKKYNDGEIVLDAHDHDGDVEIKEVNAW